MTLDAHDGDPRQPTWAFRHFLVCLDRSSLGEAVLPLTETLARAFGARITLFHVLEAPSDSSELVPADALDWEIRREEATRYLETLRDRLRRRDLDIEIKVAQGRAPEQILREAGETDVDVTVMASHGVSGISEWDLASTVHKVVTRSHRSILVIPVGSSSATNARVGRVLVPLDGSLRAECTLPIAARLAADAGAEVVLLHAVVEAEHGLPRMMTREDRELVRRLQERHEVLARRYLDETRSRLERHGASARVSLIRDGGFRRALYGTAARESPDLTIMAAHGRTGSGDQPFGKVAVNCIARPPGPLLVIQDLSPEELERCLARTVASAPARDVRHQPGAQI